MKRIILLPLFILVFPWTAFAQIPNAGFENIDTSNALTNWIFTESIAITLGDTIAVDSALILASTDAHTGQYSLELRNSFNVTTGLPFVAGAATVTILDTNMYQGFNKFLPLVSRPYSFGFYYKFAQNPFQDSAMGSIQIFNSDLEEIGTGNIIFGDLQSSYQWIETPIVYLPLSAIGMGDSIPAFYSIAFKNIVHPTNTANGQRTLIDDVSINFTPLSVPEISSETSAQIFPNPTTDKVFWKGKDISRVEIKNLLGETVGTSMTNHFDMSTLPEGLYFLHIYQGLKSEMKVLVKN